MIFAKNTIKEAARLSMAKWYNKVEEAGFHSFNVIAATFYEHHDDMLNFYNNRSSNASAESFNAKIKNFRASLRGIVDDKFFLFRLAMIYAYPTDFPLSLLFHWSCGVSNFIESNLLFLVMYISVNITFN